MEIVKILLEGSKYFTIEELSSRFKVSHRTIREDLSYVENVLEKNDLVLLRKRKLGVKIENNPDKYSYNYILSLINEKNYYSEDERKKAIMQYIFLNDAPFTVNVLSDYLDVGRNTVIRDLEKCEKWLKKHNIKLKKSTKAGTSLDYDEYSFRQAALSYIIESLDAVDYQKLYHGFNSEGFWAINVYVNEFIEYFVKDNNLVAIKNVIKKYEYDFNITFSDESFMKIFFYICISLTRIREKKLLEDVEMWYAYIEEEQSKWILSNKKFIENCIGLSLSKNESLGMVLTFLSQNKYNLKEQNYFEYINEKELVCQFVHTIEEILSITRDDIEDSVLIKNLLMHMKPAINRMKFKIHAPNPLLNEIKMMYPSIFNACKTACKIYENHFLIKFNEDEIAYMSLHIASSIERNKSAASYFHNVLIVCSSGVGTSNMVSSRLLTEFPNIVIKRICSVKEFDSANISDIDFIVSTVPLYAKHNLPVVYVNPLLNRADVENVEQQLKGKLNNISKYEDVILSQIMTAISQECNINNYSKLQGKIAKIINTKDNNRNDKRLSEFLEEDKIKFSDGYYTWEEAVIEAGDMLRKNEDISFNYIKRLLKAIPEMKESVVIGKGVAMPHTKYMEKDVFNTSISMLKLKEPIKFMDSNEQVWLIVVLAASKDNSHIGAVNELANILVDDIVLDSLKKSTYEEELLEIIKEFEINN